tara:strand:+ start:636 stop:857 length:222 start_codon:yes stop_codon:yes gene_type:complete
MGKFFISKIWLEDREIEILNKYDFTEEVFENEVEEDKRWILHDLCNKGFLYLYPTDEGNIYQNAGGYLQHFNN